MIQRIQTLFLLAIVGCMGSLFKAPIAKSDIAFQGVYQDSQLTIQDDMILLISTLLCGIVALLSIFLFRNRNLQKSMSILSVIGSIILLGYSLYMYTQNKTDSFSSELGIGFVLPILSVIAGLLAIIFINKDSKLVKSMDRLR